MTPIPPAPLEIVRRAFAQRGGAEAARVALDVGAHTGAFARELLDSGLFARVVAFEPNARIAGPLHALAASDPRLEVVAAAVGEHEARGELHSDADPATASLLPYVAGYSTRGAVDSMPVDVVMLDDFFENRRRAGESLALVKIDTQGHDLAVLRGARRLLASDRPLVIAELIYVPMYERQGTPEEIVAALRDAGYQLHSLFNIHATVEGRLAFADVLFVPAECRLPASQDYVQIDNQASLRSQIATLERICQERLEVINVLDAEVKRLCVARAEGT